MPRPLYALIAFALVALATLPAAPFATLAQTIPGGLHLPLILRGVDGLQTIVPVSTPTPRIPTATSTQPPSSPTPTATATTVPTMPPTNTPSPTDTPVPTGAVILLSSTAFVPYEASGGLYIVGELQNLTTANAGLIRINAVLRDEHEAILTGTVGYAMISTLAPDMVSPFRVIFLEAPEAWESYELTVNWDNFGADPIGLEIENPEGYFGQFDSFRVRGTVLNQTGAVREFVQIVVTLYNGDDEVIGTEVAFTNPTTIQPGQQVHFDVEVYFWAGKPTHSEIALYRVAAYGD